MEEMKAEAVVRVELTGSCLLAAAPLADCSAFSPIGGYRSVLTLPATIDRTTADMARRGFNVGGYKEYNDMALNLLLFRDRVFLYEAGLRKYGPLRVFNNCPAFFESYDSTLSLLTTSVFTVVCS
jgi:hypothetical protein